MARVREKLVEELMSLSPIEKAELVETLLSSLDKPDSEIDELWAKEAEDRLDAYNKGELKAVSLEDVLAKYR